MTITDNTIPANDPAWTPTDAFVDASNMTAFMRWIEQREGLQLVDYNALWEWSVAQPDAFWEAIFVWAEVQSPTPHGSAAWSGAACRGLSGFPARR